MPVKRKGRRRNKFARDLRTPKYKMRVVPNKKKKAREAYKERDLSNYD